MDIEKLYAKISEQPLFVGGSERVIKDALEKAQYLKVKSGQPADICNAMVYIISGSVCVYSADDRRRLLLRKIDCGGVFGVAALFSGDVVSRVYAKGDTLLAVFSAESVRQMLERDKTLMYNYIAFLSDRISYLNRKITYLTAGSAERKLAVFLDTASGDSVSLPVNFTLLSDMLDIGRASLYRALEKLEGDGCILRCGNEIKILDRLMLQNY